MRQQEGQEGLRQKIFRNHFTVLHVNRKTEHETTSQCSMLTGKQNMRPLHSAA